MLLEKLRSESIIHLGTHLKQTYNAIETTSQEREVLRERLSLRAAWWIDITAEGSIYKLAVIVDEHYPFSRPSLLTDQSQFLHMSHVEKSGKLCLLPTQATSDYRDVTGVVDSIIAEGASLLATQAAPNAQGDFVEEFQSYWASAIPECSPHVQLAAQPAGPSRPLHVLASGRFITASEISDPESWVHKLPAHNGRVTHVAGYFLWLEEPLLPSNYPISVSDAFSLLRENTVLNACEVKKCISDSRPLHVIFSFATTNGPACGGFILSGPKKRRGKPLRNGFRDATIQNSYSFEAYYGLGSVQPILVDRCDIEWLFTRGSSGYKKEIESKRIAIVGCGALGGQVAELLTQAGFLNLTLYDPESLSWDNVARHVLGARYVGYNKAKGLKHKLESKLPFLRISAVAEDWRNHSEELVAHDLILSATADWQSDCALNWLLRTRFKSPPVVYCWLEAYAVAGHALAVLDRGGCLRCGMSRVGENSKAVSLWTTPTQLRAPACGVFFQPYGVLQVVPAAAVAAELCVDILNGHLISSQLRTWIGPKSQIQQLGGSIAAVWTTLVQQGEFVNKQAWEINKDCDLC